MVYWADPTSDMRKTADFTDFPALAAGASCCADRDGPAARSEFAVSFRMASDTADVAAL